MQPLLDADSSARPGHILGGKYCVERVLGMGGMGVVVAARHVELQTRFALKLMRREAAADEESVERFLREARAAGRLKSEHCVRVIDVGKLETGAPYMVMELLVGQDLASLVATSGARAPAEAVDYILQACEGIAEAHASGIIHRDLKPQNLFVTKGVDGMPLVKVLDFGLAKTLRGNKGAHALTQTTAVMGSPMYMSPEQMRASRLVDVRSDAWSLGVCLYELLTGRTPFEGETYPEVCSLVLSGTPTPLPTDVPRGLAKVVTRCLQKDPKKRYANVAELAAALEEFASVRGAADRIRAVLDAPRSELESIPAEAERVSHDPDAETKTASSIDTAKHEKPRARGSWPSAIALGVAVAVFGIVIGLAATKPGPMHAVATAIPAPPAAPATASAPSPAPGAEPASPPLPAPAQSAMVTVEPPSKAGHVRALLPARHPPTSVAPTTAPVSKPITPVLVPKTTEF